MPATAETSRLGWLTASLSTQRQRVMDLFGRIADIRNLRFEKPALFQKFFNLMEQVAIAKEEEAHLLSAIEAIEQKHRFNRDHGNLIYPKRKIETDPTFRIRNDPTFPDDSELLDEHDEEYEDYCREYGLDTEEEKKGGMPPSVLGPPAQPLTSAEIQSVMMAYAASNAKGSSARRPSRNMGWIWLIALWLLLSGRAANRNQSLKPD